MELTQKDYDERKRRLADGTSQNPDEDTRLVEHYEREGYEWDGNSSGNSAGSTPNESSSNEPGSPSTVPSTDGPSKPASVKGRSTAPSAEKSST
jgi:hypothetical protein